MPLKCDCYPGCWGEHAKNWPVWDEKTDEKLEAVKAAVPYGSYVVVDGWIRIETAVLASRASTALAASRLKKRNDEMEKKSLQSIGILECPNCKHLKRSLTGVTAERDEAQKKLAVIHETIKARLDEWEAHVKEAFASAIDAHAVVSEQREKLVEKNRTERQLREEISRLTAAAQKACVDRARAKVETLTEFYYRWLQKVDLDIKRQDVEEAIQRRIKAAREEMKKSEDLANG